MWQAITKMLQSWGYSDALQLKWLHVYVLKVPVLKFVLYEASNAALAAVITMLPSAIEL